MRSTCDFVGFVMLWLKLFHSGVDDDGDHFPEKVSLVYVGCNSISQSIAC